MHLQSRSKEEPEINLTSLIDVVLLLLVFFMVSTSFVRESEINLSLPESGARSEPAAAVESLEIGITQTGNYAVNGRQLVNNERRTLRLALERAIDGRPPEQRGQVEVFIRADASVDFQAVVTAMDVAGQLGFVDINIATVTAPDG